MAVNVSGGGLNFDVQINDADFDNALDSLQQKLTKTYEDQRRAQEAVMAQQRQYANIILSTGSAFKALDTDVQNQLRTLSALNIQYRQIADARQQLDKRFTDGVIGVETYSGSLAALINQERAVSTAIQTVTDHLSQNDAVMGAANGSINQKIAQLEQLKAQYNALSETDRNNTGISTPILSQIQGLGTELSNIQSAFTATEQNALGSINERRAALAQLTQEYEKLSAVDRTSTTGQQMLSNIQAVDAEVRQLSNSFTAVQQNAAGSINEKIASLQRLRTEYAALSETDRNNSRIGGAMLSNIRQLDHEVRTLNTDFSQTQSIASKVALAVGSYLTLNAATDFVKQLVAVRGEFEQLNVAFNVMLGNKDQADKLMAQAVQLAATTPFKLTEVASGAKQLLAYGTAADDIIGSLQMLGNIASGVGAPLNDIVYLYGTLQTQGRAYTRDILQFTSRGIPIIGELAKQFHVSTAEVQQLVEAGKVGFPEVQKAFQSMTSQGGMFFNLMERQSQTVTGQISNLGDAFDVMLNQIGQSNEGIIKGSIAGLTDLVKNYQNVIDTIEVLVATYGAYKTAVLTSAAVTSIAEAAEAGFTAAEILHYQTTLLTTRATALLNKTMLANPYVLAVTAIAALVVVLYELHDSTTAVERATKSLREEEEAATKQKEDLKAQTEQLLATIKSETATRYEQLDAFKQLQRLYPSVLNSLDLQKFKTLDANEAQKQFNKAIDETDLSRKVKEYEALQKQIEQLKQAMNAPTVSGGTGGIGGSDFAGVGAQRDLETATEKAKLLKKAIDEEKQAQFEANASPAQLAKYYQDALDVLQKQRDQVEQTLSLSKQTGKQFLDWKDTIAQTSLSTLDSQIASIADKLKALVNPNTQSNKQLIDASASIETLEALRSKILADYNKEQDNSRREQLAKDLEYADKRKKVLDVYGAANTSLKQQDALETKINAILDQRKGILEKITGLQRDSKQSGLIPNESAVDNVKQKYDEAIQSIDDYNNKIADFNKKHSTKLQGIGLADVEKLKNAEAVEIANTQYKQDSANYVASLDDKKKAFDDFQKIQQDGSNEQIAYAKNAYKDQIGDFNSYLEFLKSQQSDLKFKVSIEPNNVGLQESLIAVNKAIVAETNKQQADALQKQIADYNRLFTQTETFNIKRKQIEEQYYKDVALLARQYSGKELTERMAVLTKGKNEAIDTAKDEYFQKTALYEKLNQQITEISREQTKAQISAIQTVLSKGVEIPPALKEQLQSNLDRLQSSLKYSSSQNYVKALQDQKQAAIAALATGKLSTEEFKKQLDLITQINGELKDHVAKTLDDISKGASEISGSIGNLANALQPFNAGLADTLQTVSDIGGVLSNAAGAASSFATGDIVGGISKTIDAIAGVFSIGAKARESERKAMADLKTYQDNLVENEVKYNELMRDRLRTQGDITNMTVAELNARQQMLDLEKSQAQADYARLLQQIQQTGNQITGEHTDKYGGFLGIGRKTKVVQDLAGLSDADYATLEKLFTEGKLDDATAKWFEQLKAVHDELDDIGTSAQELKDQLNQTLTGTTSDAISSSIKDGFANGYESAADFAGNLQKLFSDAILSAFEANQIRPAMQKFYDQLAAYNSDGLLDQGEIAQLKDIYNNTVDSLAKQYDQIKQISNLSAGSDAQNSLVGAIKGMTEQSAELLAGQFGAQRMTMVEILQVSTQQLNQLVLLTNYAADIPNIKAILRDMSANGIKIK